MPNVQEEVYARVDIQYVWLKRVSSLRREIALLDVQGADDIRVPFIIRKMSCF